MTTRADNDTGPDAVSAGSQRLDKWLWYARVAKSRTQAAGLIIAGKIRVNRERVVKPSQLVKPGDVVTSTAKKDVRVLQIKATGERRGPAPEAAFLYEELTERAVRPNASRSVSGAEASGDADSAVQGERARGAGRPTKRDRRRIDQLQGEH